MIDDRHPRAQLFDVGHVVGGEQHRGPAFAVEFGEESLDRGLGHHVQTDSRFVQVDDFRIVQQRGGEIAAHALAERKLPDGCVEERCQVQQVHETVQVLAEPVRRDAVDVAEQVEAVPQGQVPPQGCPLPEHDSDTAGEFHPLAGRVEPGDAQVTATGYEDPDQHLDGRGLACAVRPQIADHLAGRDPKREITNGLHVDTLTPEPARPLAEDEGLCNPLNLNHGHMLPGGLFAVGMRV